MSSGSSSSATPPGVPQGGSASARPDWADGLRHLYDSVVDEPLPDAFKDLLAKLDDDSADEEGRSAGDSSEQLD